MAAITPRDRVILAIQHKEPGRVPYHISYTTAARLKLETFYRTPDLDTVLDNHIVKYKPRGPGYSIEEKPGYFRDEWGTLWNKIVDPDIGVPVEYPLTGRSLAGFAVPDPHQASRYQNLPSFIERNPDRYRVVSIGRSLFERAWMCRGLQEILVDMVEDPAWFESLLDAILEMRLGLIDEVVKYDIDAVLFGDDWGTQRGLLFNPKLWRRFIKPRIALMYGAVKKVGKAVIIHCCGKVQELFPELIELGLDVFNPFQPEVMELQRIKHEFGKDLTFYGGMGVQSILPFGTQGTVREEAQRLMHEFGRDGGYIIAPSHDMPGDIPLENMVAFIEAVRDGGEG